MDSRDRSRAGVTGLAALALLLAACAQPSHVAPEPAAPSKPATPALEPAQEPAPPPAAEPPLGRATPTKAPGPTRAPSRPAAIGRLSGLSLIAFSSNRPGTGRGFDVYLFDVGSETVFALPGMNTPGDELDPNLTGNNRYIAYVSNYPHGNFDLRLYDLLRELEDTLTPLNTPADELSPSISDDGTALAYLSAVDGVARLRLGDLRTRTAYRVPAAPQLEDALLNPQISGDGRWVAFAALSEAGDADVLLYDIRRAQVLTPPFVNTAANEDEPVPSSDGRELLFVTDRRGSRDIYLADLASGFVDALPLANSEGAEEDASFFGVGGIQFETTREGEGERRYMIYNRRDGALDTLPVMHELGTLDQ